MEGSLSQYSWAAKLHLILCFSDFEQEQKLEDCNHAQIVHLVDLALGELQMAFVRDKQLDGVMMREYKSKKFGSDVAEYADDKKLRGKAPKLWRALQAFDVGKISGNNSDADQKNSTISGTYEPIHQTMYEIKGLDDDDIEEVEEQKYPQNDDIDVPKIAAQHETEILDSFCSVTDCDREIGVLFLKDSEWSLTIALERFYKLAGDVTRLKSWKQEDEHRQRSIANTTGTEDVVYTEGIRFWYWVRERKPESAVLVHQRHRNLKEEMLATRHMGIKLWERHEKKCKMLLQAKFVRNQTANAIAVCDGAQIVH